MRTELRMALALCALAGALPAQAQGRGPLQLGLSSEATAVGLSYGLRPEVNYRLGEADTASQLRASVGALVGPEFFYLPLSLGYRAEYRSLHSVRPLLGVGLELQNRIVSGAPVASSFGVYLEAGVLFAFGERWSAGLVLSPDVMILGGPGAGLAARAQLSWRP